jgi:chromate transporter
LHTVFSEVVEFGLRPARPEAPVLSSVDWRAALSRAAELYWPLQSGLMPTLVGSAAAGVVLSFVIQSEVASRRLVRMLALRNGVGLQ